MFAGNRRRHNLFRRGARRELYILRYIANACIATQRHRTGVWLHARAENLQQRRLARAIRSNESESLAFRNPQRDILEQRARPVGLREGITTNQQAHVYWKTS